LLVVDHTNEATRSFQPKGRLALEERFFHYGRSDLSERSLARNERLAFIRKAIWLKGDLSVKREMRGSYGDPALKANCH
jgi:hypothetical protein